MERCRPSQKNIVGFVSLQKPFGILYQHLLHDFARRIGSDFYILPSSVHEVLLIPADNQISMSTLSSMVRDVNSSQLAREEILSDHVYYYSLETDQITM